MVKVFEYSRFFCWGNSARLFCTHLESVASRPQENMANVTIQYQHIDLQKGTIFLQQLQPLGGDSLSMYLLLIVSLHFRPRSRY